MRAADAIIEADVFRYADAHITDALQRLIRDHHDPTTIDVYFANDVMQRVFSSVFGHFGSTRTYNRELSVGGAPEIGCDVNSIKDLLGELQETHELLSIHFYEPIHSARRSILGHFSDRYVAGLSPEKVSALGARYEFAHSVYQQMSHYERPLHKRTLVQAVHDDLRGSTSFVIAAKKPILPRRSEFNWIPFPSATSTAAAELNLAEELLSAFETNDPQTAIGSVERVIEAAGDSRFRSGYDRFARSFSTSLGLTNGSSIPAEEANHICAGLQMWHSLVGLLPYTLIGLRFDTLFAISLCAFRFEERLSFSASVLDRLRGLVRGMSGAIGSAAQQLKARYAELQVEARFARQFGHDAEDSLVAIGAVADRCIDQLAKETTTFDSVSPKDDCVLRAASDKTELRGLSSELFELSMEAEYLRRLLTHMRSRAGKSTLALTPEPINWRDIFRSLAWKLRWKGKEEDLSAVAVRFPEEQLPLAAFLSDGVRLSFTTQPQVPRYALRFVLDNLVRNSLDQAFRRVEEGATRPPRVEVELSAEVKLLPERPAISISVSDTGPPMPNAIPSNALGLRLIRDMIQLISAQVGPAQFNEAKPGSHGLGAKVFRVVLPAAQE